MEKVFLLALPISASVLLSGCANSSYNNNSYQSPNDREVNKVIDEEVNSLSKKDIEQLNKLK
jgi:outer membrane lipoprotein SlyB